LIYTKRLTLNQELKETTVKWQIAETDRICKLYILFFNLSFKNKNTHKSSSLPKFSSYSYLGTAHGQSSRSRMCPDDQIDRQK